MDHTPVPLQRGCFVILEFASVAAENCPPRRDPWTVAWIGVSQGRAAAATGRHSWFELPITRSLSVCGLQGWWVGEILCFVLYAQKKLFMHYVGALYCFFGMIGASFERNGYLLMRDSFASLALDVPRLLLALYLLAKVHTFCAFCIRSCCGYSDDWSMGTRSAEVVQCGDGALDLRTPLLNAMQIGPDSPGRLSTGAPRARERHER